MKGATSTGFEFELEAERLDDYELLEALCDIDNGDGSRVPEMVERLLGKEQKNRLKDHIRNVDGKVSTQALLKEVMEIFKYSNEGKN